MPPPRDRLARWLVLLFIVFLSTRTAAGDRNPWAVSQQGPFRVTLVETAEIAAVDQADISAPKVWNQSLQITDLVPEGTHVRAGGFLIQFDDRESRAELDQAEDALLSLEADLEELQARQSLRTQELRNSLEIAGYAKEQAELRLEGSRFESDARQAIVRLQLRQAEIRRARVETEISSQEIIHRSQLIKLNTRIEQARARVATGRRQLKELRIEAPRAGLVTYRRVGRWNSQERLRKGYTAWPGEALMSIPDLARMEAQLSVNEIDWPRIRVGQPARISLDAYPEVALAGQVASVAKLTQASPNPSSPPGFPVIVAIEGIRPDLKPGMTARVELLLDELPDAISVPAGILFELSGQPVLFVRGAKRATPVRLGPRNDTHVVITQGITAGQELSWTAPVPEAVALGSALEFQRIAEAEAAIARDLAVLAERGLLFEYGTKERLGAGPPPDAGPDQERPAPRAGRGEGRPGNRSGPPGEGPGQGQRQRTPRGNGAQDNRPAQR